MEKEIINFNLERFWLQDIIILSQYPDENIRKFFADSRCATLSTFDLGKIKSETMKQEIKNYLRAAISKRSMGSKCNRRTFVYPLHSLIVYLIERNIETIKNISIEAIKGYEDFLIKTGIEKANRNKSNRASDKQKIIWRVLRCALINSSDQEKFDCDVWMIFDINLYHGNEIGMLFFNGLSEEIKNDLKSFLNHRNSDFDFSHYNMRILSPVRLLAEYCIESNVSRIEEIESEHYKEYIKERGKPVYLKGERNKYSIYINILNQIWVYKDELRHPIFFERDFWDLTQLDIENNRKNLICEKNSMSFKEITNEKNKRLEKIYLKHLIVETPFSISTIVARHYSLSKFMVHFDEGIENVKREELINFIKSGDREDKSKSNDLQSLKDFFFYLNETGVLDNRVLFKTDYIKSPVKHLNRAADEYVISQIFNILDKIPEDLMLIYLILYCTGVRISEALTIQRDALFKSSQGFLLKTTSTKMKKEQYNAIPMELFLILDSYIKRTCCDSKSKYIFKSDGSADKPLKYFAFSDRINEQFQNMGIKLKNGDDYRMDIHGYRHRLATEMHEQRISPFIIQKTLHHESIEMTMAYIDLFEKDIKKSYQDFYDKNGEKFLPNAESERIILNYLDEALNTQALPNGICTLPVKLKNCDHANACLTCPYFITNEKYIDNLKCQLVETENILAVANRNAWVMQIATNEEIEKNLKSIISRIEVVKNEDSK